MKKIIFAICVLYLFSLSGALAQDNDWYITRSTHFIVYYKNAKEDFLNRLIERAEDYYEEIAENLGFRRFDFWLWDKRAKIYIYDTAQDYQEGTGQPSWSGGCAIARSKIIKTFTEAPGFFDTVLPHEMGHIIFREFVGFNNNAVPIWLDEGVASYQEKFRRATARRIAKKAVEDGAFMDLRKLANFSPPTAKDAEEVNLFYAESLSAVDFLINEFDIDNFVFFCQNLRDKEDLDKAIRSAYPFMNVDSLSRAWKESLTER
ncbi:MAG: hypothetical protein FJZ13_03670 [Candidatus Omnitrophica bacterium]|nr:hypothetical protein [Candidatus Omnitrophota bacterium]